MVIVGTLIFVGTVNIVCPHGHYKEGRSWRKPWSLWPPCYLWALWSSCTPCLQWAAVICEYCLHCGHLVHRAYCRHCGHHWVFANCWNCDYGQHCVHLEYHGHHHGQVVIVGPGSSWTLVIVDTAVIEGTIVNLGIMVVMGTTVNVRPMLVEGTLVILGFFRHGHLA